jgi:class 3 adenylate cyclase
MTGSALAYLPEDRRLALARGVELPRRSTGSALFADISGFTPLTESLVRAHGPQRGAEELLVVLNAIYDALVAEVAGRRGSVIVYSGDAITCWFDDAPLADAPLTDAPLTDAPLADAVRDGAARRAVACATALQRAMERFGSVAVGDDSVALAVKVAVTTGPAVRAVVGDPSIQLIDTLAGDTVRRLADAEHHADAGEVVIDQATVDALGDEVDVIEWRERADGLGGPPGERFAVVAGLYTDVELDPWPEVGDHEIAPGVQRSWMIPPVADRLDTGLGEFLTELRPAVSLFMRFDGIDYDGDPQAPEHLDTLVRATQAVLLRFDAFILQVTIGDKGSYINTTFGAPIAHGDDAVRAITAALELRDLDAPSVTSLQIGIAQGRTRAGACGATTRRCYGVMGDPVNLSARLMSRAADREILVEAAVRRAAAVPFHWEDLAPITVKGKSQPIEVANVTGHRQRSGNRLRERAYTLPLFGRAEQLATLTATLERALTGRGQVVGLVGDAGLGKSRLVAEVLRLAEARGATSYGGECQSFGLNAGYHVWHAVWRDVFELDGNDAPEEQQRQLATVLDRIDPALTERLPLLGNAVNLLIADNDLTEAFDAALRKASLEALLVEVFRARVRELGPTVLVIEDAHWLDPLSHDLLEVIGRAVVDLPVFVLTVYRPPEAGFLVGPKVSRLAHFTEVRIDRLADDDLRALAVAKLRALQRVDDGVPPADDLLDLVCARAEGNPFYVEELVNYLDDRGIDTSSPEALRQVQLPDSLHSLILGRIDQLTEDQRTLLKVASVIGRLFQAAMLWGVHRTDGSGDPADPAERQRLLDRLVEHDLTTVDSPEPELAYLFKHVLTQEVAYETLAFATRAVLHEEIGRYLETHRTAQIEQHLDLLAHHYDRTENLPKRREYLGRAGAAARAAYANVAAVDYFERLLPLVDGADRIPVLLQLADVLEVTGEWDTAETAAREALALATTGDLARPVPSAHAARSLGTLARKRGDYAVAQEWMERALADFARADDPAGRSLAAADVGEILRLQGRYLEARAQYDESLAIAADVADDHARLTARAHALKGAGTVATWQGDYEEARRLNDESLAIRRELGDVPGVAVLLNNQGIIARFRQELDEARRLNDEALALFREMGDRFSTGQLLNNQACVAADQGDHDQALQLLDECLEIRRRLGDRAGLNLSLITLADVLVDLGRVDDARPVLDESLALCLELNDRTMLAYLLEDLAGVNAADGRPAAALRCAGYASALRDEIGAPLPPNEQARVDALLAPARQALDAASVDEALAAGAALAAGQSIDELLAGS